MKVIFLLLFTVFGSVFFMIGAEEKPVVVDAVCACDRAADSLVLVELYDSTSVISDWQNPWNFNDPMWSWEGVRLNSEGCVDSLAGGGSWNGSLPNVIGQLCFLEVLQINSTELSGPIPDSLGNLSNLRVLQLSNSFEGEIPVTIGNLLNLEVFTLHSENITGSIPESIYNLTLLKQLALTYTQINGTLSESIGNLVNLESLSIYGTNTIKMPLSGGLPGSIGNLENLAFLWIKDTNIEGPIPPGIGSLANVVNLNLSGNSLSGSLPDEMENLTSLYFLFLGGNSLSGPLPEWIDNFTNLHTLSIAGNEFSESLPDSFGNLNNLAFAYLGNNNFSGSLPESIGNLQGLYLLKIENNDLSGEIPESLTNMSTLSWFTASGNQLTGAVPLFSFSFGGSKYLQLKNNNLSELPQFSDSISWSTNEGFTVNNNRLTFDDILPNLDKLTPPFNVQDSVYVDTSIVVQYPGNDSIVIDLGIDENLQSNKYFWNKDGVLFTAIQGNNTLKITNIEPDHAGVYTCRIINDSVPESSLTLYSHSIQVVVNIPGTISDSLELVRFYNATNGDEWFQSWELNNPINTWDFISLDNGRVTEIKIDGNNNLNGTLIDFQLPKLTTLKITGNPSMTGPLFDFTGIEKAIDLEISDCSLTGNIPGFSNLEKLQELNLSNNDLNGNIPEFNNFPFLEILNLSRNQLVGEIPNFDQVWRLQELVLNQNFNLGDTLPEFSNIFLDLIDVSYCNLSGAVPTFINCPEMKDLILNHNHFTSIPDTFYISELRTLDLAFNDIYDRFPILLSTGISQILLNDNQFFGSVPELNPFGSISGGLRVIVLSNNKFSGAIPDISNLDIREYKLDGNNFTYLPNLSLIDPWSDCVGNCAFLVQYNNLSFDDIIPNLGVVVDDTWIYSPQDSFLTQTELFLSVGESYTIDLEIDPNITNNNYEWFKNGVLWATTNENKLDLNSFNQPATDTFQCQVTNPQVPDLTLNSREIIIHICEPLESSIEELLCDGDSLTVNGTVYNQDTPEGEEYINVPNEEGCDSLVHIQLDFYTKSEKVIVETISQGSSIEFAGTTYDSTGIYETILIGQAHTGCDSIIRLDLTVVPQDVVLDQDFPNAFTPDGDGLNDRFVIPTLQSQPENFPNNEFLIFSRGSQALYQAKSYQNDWDGRTTDGQELPTGTYYYIFQYKNNGQAVVKKGKILLMR